MLALLAVVLGEPVLLLVALVLAVGKALAAYVDVDLVAPAALLAVTAAATLVGLAAGVTGVDLLGHPLATACALVGTVAGLSCSSWLRATGTHLERGRFARAAQLPALVPIAVAALQAADLRVPVSWSLYGTDIAEHLRLLRQVQADGALNYADQAYPRGLHMLAALVSSAGLPTSPAALLGHDLRLFTALLWLCVAAVVASAASMTVRVGRALGLAERPAAVAALGVASFLVLSNTFIEMFAYLGAAPGLLAMTAMWATPFAVTAPSGRGTLRLLVVSSTSTMLLAHLWQPLCVVSLAAFGGWIAPRLRRGTAARAWRAARQRPLATSVALAWAGLMAAAAAVPLLSVTAAGGASLAAIPGEAPRVPVVLLAGGIISCGFLIRGARAAVPRMLLAGACGAACVVAVALRGAGHGLDLTQWYPNKAAWFWTVFLLPVMGAWLPRAAGLARQVVVRTTAPLGAAARVSRVLVVGLVVAGVVGFVLPRADLPGTATLRVSRSDSGTESARRYDLATTFATRYAPAVTVPIFTNRHFFEDSAGPYIVSKLISFQTGQSVTHGLPAAACADLAAAGGERPVVALTTLDPSTLEALLRAQKCSRRPVRVENLPGLAPSEQALLRSQVR